MPQAPVHMVMPPEWQLALTIAFGIFAAASYAYGLVLASRSRNAFPLLVIVGGTVAVLLEAPIDILGLCYWPEQGQWTAYEAFGRRIPWITVGAYTTFYGGVVLYTLRQFEQGLEARRLWKWFSIWMIFEWTWEPVPIYFGVWNYYGAQPFRVLDFPLWWPPVNTVGAYTAAYLLHRVRPHLKGFSMLLAVPLVASGDAMGNAAVAWPLWVTMNSNLGYVATVPAGILTLILCAAAIFAITRSVGTKKAVPHAGVRPVLKPT